MTVASSDNIAKRILMSPFRDDEKARMDRGRLTLLIFIGVLVVIILLQAYIRVPIQTVLILLAIVIMIIGKAKLQDLMAGLILHPIMAMTAGFLIAGALGLDDLAALSAAREETGRPAAAAAAKRMRRLGRQSRLAARPRSAPSFNPASMRSQRA